MGKKGGLDFWFVEKRQELLRGEEIGGLSASASLNHHILVVFQHNLLVLIHIEQTDRAEIRGHATGLRHGPDVGVVHQTLNRGVVGGVEVVRQGEVAFPHAKVGVVVRRREDPLVPADVGEIHIQGIPENSKL